MTSHVQSRFDRAGGRPGPAGHLALLSPVPSTLGHGDVAAPAPARGLLTPVALLMFPALAALGRYATVDLSPAIFPNFYVLLCALTLVPALICLIRWGASSGAMPMAFLILVLVWVVWAPLTLVWAPDVGFGVNRISLASAALVSGLCVLGLAAGSSNGVQILRLGWTLAFAATGAVSLWELNTGRHLDANQAVLQSGVHVVASTFYNPNNYAGFLLACLPFLIWNAILARSVWSRYLHIGLIAGWWVLVAATQSRTGLVGAVVAAPLLCYWMVRSAMLRRRRIALPVLLLGLGVVAGLSFLPVATLGQQALADLQSQFAPGDSISASDQARLNLTMLGWRMFLDSWMLGHGAGAFASTASYWGGLELYGLTNAHNGIVEIAAEYGLPVLLPLVVVVAAVARAAIARHPAATRADLLDFRMVILLGLIAVVASNLVASSILLSPWWWLLLGQLSAQSWLLPRQWTEVERRRAAAASGPGRHRSEAGGGPPDPRRPFVGARAAGS